jgi:uncharacterized protein
MAASFRRFRLARKQPESSVITSFYFVPLDGGGLWPARPGQYLTLRIPGPNGPVLRTYSLSNAVDAQDAHRISVKREGGVSGAPDGIGSCWLHDRLEEGAEIEIAAPRGTFLLDEETTRPVLLLAGGVGLTPLLSMLHRLVKSERQAWLVHASENGAVQALRNEVAALAVASGGRISVTNVLRNPDAADRASGRADAQGLIDRPLLQQLLPLDDYQVYLCGPVPFMVAMWRLLTGLGIAPERIAYEFFGKGGSLPAMAADGEAPARQEFPRIPVNAPKSLSCLHYLTDPDKRAIADPQAHQAKAGKIAEPTGDQVVFARSGITLAWNSGVSSILELAESAGLNPAFVCRAGICNSCKCGLTEGVIDYISAPLDPPEPGKALICCSRPSGRVILDL